MSATDTTIDDDTQEPQAQPLEDQYEYYKARPNLQVWLILGGIAFVVAVSVLFIYQAGDNKTILTMEPMQPVAFANPAPAATTGRGGGGCPQPGMCGAQPVAFATGGGCPQPGGACGAQPVAFGTGGGCPQPGGACGAQPVAFGSRRGTGGGVNCPGGGRNTSGGGAAATPTLAATNLLLGQQQPLRVRLPDVPEPNATAKPAHCHRCGNNAMPLCAQDNSVMLPLNESLFYCPQCGAVASPPCPYCGARMTPGEQPEVQPGSQALAAGQPLLRETPEAVGGQFVCSRCGATGLPNWDANGVPLCPACGAAMTVRGAQATP